MPVKSSSPSRTVIPAPASSRRTRSSRKSSSAARGRQPSPGGGLEDILAALRDKTPAEDDRGEAVDLEELADHIDDNDPLPATASTRPDLRHPDEVRKPGPMNQLRDGLPPLMWRGIRINLKSGRCSSSRR